jgi:hypothetical protein
MTDDDDYNNNDDNDEGDDDDDMYCASWFTFSYTISSMSVCLPI